MTKTEALAIAQLQTWRQEAKGAIERDIFQAAIEAATRQIASRKLPEYSTASHYS